MHCSLPDGVRVRHQVGDGQRGLRCTLLAIVVVLTAGCTQLDAMLDDLVDPDPTVPTSSARPPGVPSDAYPAAVDRVVDGDTIRMHAEPDGPLGQRGSVAVRLLNIDAPELSRDGVPGECLARVATRRVEELLDPGDTVWLAADVEDRDQYDRPLRGVWTEDGRFVNTLLAEEGLAVAVLFEPNDRFHAEVVAAERRARAARVGLHGDRCP